MSCSNGIFTSNKKQIYINLSILQANHTIIAALGQSISGEDFVFARLHMLLLSRLWVPQKVQTLSAQFTVISSAFNIN